MGFNFTDKFTGRHVRGGTDVLTNPYSKASNQFFGLANVGSDTNGPSVVVSTALVNSNSLIFWSLEAGTAVQSSSLTNMLFCVACKSPQGYFKLATVNSTTNVGSFVVAWQLINPK